jgi:hypothetical protein
VIHYHGTPITPIAALYELSGRHFCVSHFRPEQVARCHEIGQSMMLDNGAYSKWRRGVELDWAGYYAWADRWLDYPTTWAVIPDEIGAGSQEQDALIRDWPHGTRGAPVFHLDADMSQPLSRLLRLIDQWPRVCIGWAEPDLPILGDAYCRAMDAMWNAVARTHRRTPALHKLRGMQLSGKRWPFASVDSTDIAQNHSRPQNTPRAMADRWDAMQTPAQWVLQPEQMELLP